jgi:hypothetical protein
MSHTQLYVNNYLRQDISARYRVPRQHIAVCNPGQRTHDPTVPTVTFADFTSLLPTFA